jgi:hypothetical protein
MACRKENEAANKSDDSELGPLIAHQVSLDEYSPAPTTQQVNGHQQPRKL